jgi:hypothetical protein
VLDEIVDNPALQFDRDDLQQSDAACQQQQCQLMHPARGEHIAIDIARQPTRGGGREFPQPSRNSHRAKTQYVKSSLLNNRDLPLFASVRSCLEVNSFGRRRGDGEQTHLALANHRIAFVDTAAA